MLLRLNKLRIYSLIIALGFLVACQETNQYDESKFDEMKKTNKLIETFGTFRLNAIWDSFHYPELQIDSNLATVFTYRNSDDSIISISGKWIEQNLDSQVFSFAPPLKYGIFSNNGIYMLDSNKMIHFKKQKAK